MCSITKSYHAVHLWKGLLRFGQPKPIDEKEKGGDGRERVGQMGTQYQTVARLPRVALGGKERKEMRIKLMVSRE